VKGEIPAGRIIPVKITGASVYDLSGVSNVPDKNRSH
jgi:hypothetical protein